MNTTKRIILAFALMGIIAPLFAQTPVAELNFYKKQSQEEDKQLLATLCDDISVWLNKNSASADAEDALFLQAQLLARTKQYPAAFITLLRYKYEFPASKTPGAVKDLSVQIVDGLRSKERDAATAALAVNVTAVKTEDRLAAFLSAATQMDIKDTYNPLLAQYRAFFTRFAQYEDKDKLELMLGDLHRQNKNYQSALMQYNKVYDIYPATRYKAASLRMMGDIYAGDLKDYSKADYYYQTVLNNFPASVERGVTYHHLAMLQETQRDYNGAVASLDKAIEIYSKENQTDGAYEALRYKAEIQKTRFKDYAAATDTLKKTAELVAKDQNKYIDTMFESAYIYGRKLKDDYAQLNCLENIVINFPAAEQAPQALFDAGQLAEKLDNNAKAKTNYNRLIVSYPESPLAVKAQRRINSITAKEAKEEAKAADAELDKVIAPAAPATAQPAQATQSAAQTAAEDDGEEADDTFFAVEDDEPVVTPAAAPAKSATAAAPAKTAVKKALPVKKAK